VGELREKLDGVADDTEVAAGLPVEGGVMPVPLDNAVDIKDQDDNPWLLLVPAASCGGCGGCDDGGCGGEDPCDGGACGAPGGD